MNLASAISDILNIDPEANAVDFEGEWTNWGTLHKRLQRVSAALGEVAADEARVGVLIRNHRDMVQIMLALFSSNRCLATLNAATPDHKLAEDISGLGAAVIIGTAEDCRRDAVIDAARQAGATLIAVDGDTVEIAVHGNIPRDRQSTAPGVAIEMLSSGTTGKPKRIPLRRINFEAALAGAAAYEKDRAGNSAPKLRRGVQIVMAPLAHIAGVTGLMNNLLAGRQICIVDRFTVPTFADAVLRHRPKVVNTPPAAIKMIMDADVPVETFAGVAAVRSGTAPLDPDLADAFYERYGVPVLQAYGATEFAGGVAGWTMDDFREHRVSKRGSVGRLQRGVEAHVVDAASGERLAPGETGLLELRAPNLDDGKGWVRTTDIAVVDADGFVWIKGRHDGAIIRGGFKVMPEEVSDMMHGHPAVREACVIGMKDERLGEVPVAGWIARTGATPVNEEAFKTWLKERLMPYQVPVRIVQLEEMPRTPSLKVDQPALRELLAG